MSTVSATGFEPVPVPGSVWAGDSVSYLRGEKPLHDYLFQHAEEVPERIAYIYYGTEITWAEAGDAVRRLAAHLREKGWGPATGWRCSCRTARSTFSPITRCRRWAPWSRR